MQPTQRDRFDGLGDFDPVKGIQRAELDFWRNYALDTTYAARVAYQCLTPGKKLKVADLKKQIEMAREELAKVLEV